MGNTSSMLTQYDLEELQAHCKGIFDLREIISLYERFCALDRTGKGFILGDEFMAIPEFALNPLAQVYLQLSFFAKGIQTHCVFLQSFSRSGHRAGLECTLELRMLRMLEGVNFKEFIYLLSAFSQRASFQHKVEFIFKVYDSDGNGKVTIADILEVLRDLSGSFLTEEQREEVVRRALEEAGFSKDCALTYDDFLKVLGKVGLKMEIEVPVD